LEYLVRLFPDIQICDTVKSGMPGIDLNDHSVLSSVTPIDISIVAMCPDDKNQVGSYDFSV